MTTHDVDNSIDLGRAPQCLAAVFALLLVGWGSARYGLIEPPMRKVIAKMVYSVLMPAYLLLAVTRVFEATMMREYWHIMILPVIWDFLGIGVGQVVGKIIRSPDSFQRGLVAAIAFPTSGGLAMAMLASLAPPLLGERNGDIAVAILAVYTATGVMLQFSVGGALLKPKTQEQTSAENARNESGSEDEAESITLTDRIHADKQRKVAEFLSKAFSTAKEAVCVPPVIAVVAGVLFSVVVPRTYVELYIHRPGAPFHWLWQALELVSQPAIALNLILAGSNLPQGLADAAELPVRCLVGAVFSRMLIMPCIIACLMMLLEWSSILDWLGPAPGSCKGCFWLPGLLPMALPTANNMVILTELAGENSKVMSMIIFAQYLCAPLTLMLVLQIFVRVILAVS